jgi:hypothetical protein
MVIRYTMKCIGERGFRLSGDETVLVILTHNSFYHFDTDPHNLHRKNMSATQLLFRQQRTVTKLRLQGLHVHDLRKKLACSIQSSGNSSFYCYYSYTDVFLLSLAVEDDQRIAWRAPCMPVCRAAPYLPPANQP